MPPLHDEGYHGEGVIVAMLDTGYDITHDGFAGLDVTIEVRHGDDSVAAEIEAVAEEHSGAAIVMASHGRGRSSAIVGSVAAIILVAIGLQASGRLTSSITTEHYHDLGKLLFAFVIFWGYIAFSQYMLIWYANIPEETIWYVHRQDHGWTGVSVALAVLRFGVPFLLLLPGGVTYALAQDALPQSDTLISRSIVYTIMGIGVVLAIGMAWLFRKRLVPGESGHFVMELPPYRLPTWTIG